MKNLIFNNILIEIEYKDLNLPKDNWLYVKFNFGIDIEDIIGDVDLFKTNRGIEGNFKIYGMSAKAKEDDFMESIIHTRPALSFNRDTYTIKDVSLCTSPNIDHRIRTLYDQQKLKNF